MTTGSNSYRDLVVWQQAMELVHGIYEVTSHFPDAEKFGLTSQMRRAAVSVACNIAEGQGRNSTGEFIQFLGHSRGSLQEVETQLLVAERRRFISAPATVASMKQCERVRKLLNGLMISLREAPSAASKRETGNGKRETI
jgi:four helix bundle protein